MAMRRIILMTACLFAACASSPLQPTKPSPDPCTLPARANEHILMSFNIHAGRTAPIMDVARFITSLDADIVALQEIDIGVRRTGEVDQMAVLASQTGLHPLFVKTLDYQGGDYGLGLLSRFPISGYEVLELPFEDERRVAVIVDLAAPSGLMRIALTHLGGSDQVRSAQVDALLDIAAAKRPLLLLGDFNHLPSAPHHARILEAGWADFWGHSETPITSDIRGVRGRIDYIYSASDATLTCAEVIPSTTSDHFPIRARVRANERPAYP